MPFRPGPSLTLIALATAAAGQDSAIVGPRALAMGGANVASVDNHTAQFYNPAALAFFGRPGEDGLRAPADNQDLAAKRWGVGVDGGAGVRLHGEIDRYLQMLDEVDQDRLSNGIVTEEDLEQAANLAVGLPNISAPDNAFTADGNAGLSVRVGPFALGVRTLAEVSGKVGDLDLTNLGFSGQTGSDLADAINATGSPTASSPQLLTPEVLGTAAYNDLLSSLGGDTAAVSRLDYQLQQIGTTPAEAAQAADLFTTVANGGGGPLSDNTTSIRFSGFGLAEFPLSYGYAFNDHLALGGSVKMMIGRVYGSEQRIYGREASDLFSQARREYHQSVNVGVDLSLLARMPYLQFGITGRNLNAPSFEGFTRNGASFADLRLDPQVTVGAAFIPWSTLTIAADIDATVQETALPGYENRRLSGGVEWDILGVVALRAGAYTNLAEDDIPYVLTAGIGLDLWALRIDLAGAASPETATYDGREYPREARADLGIAVDF